MTLPIALVGLPGSGKSTIGKSLALQLNVPFLDLDTILEDSFGMRITEFFAQKGEDEFRKQEALALQKVIEGNIGSYILATGGGTPCFGNNLKLLKQYTLTVYLKASWSELANRLHHDSQRPLLQELNKGSLTAALKQKFEWRLPFYEQANVIVDNTKEPQELLQEIKKAAGL